MQQDVGVIPINARRSNNPLLHLPFDLIEMYSALRTCEPDVVQAFALQPSVVVTLALLFAPTIRKIYTITGLGLIDIDDRWPSRLMRSFVYRLLRVSERTSWTCFVFENSADPTRLGFRAARPKRKMFLMGAGVNEAVFTPRPLPTVPPLKLAIVSRMIWSKGVDLAVEAVSRLIHDGAPIELDIYGNLDFENRRYFPVEQLHEWGHRSGIRWHGFVTDVAGVWATHHAGLFPSRGGEGLPRALLEAASCGRAGIAAEVPGCADFIRSGLEGLLVKPNSVNELAGAIDQLVRDPSQLVRMGNAARQRVLDNCTEEIITSRYRQLFTQMFQEG